MIRVIVNWLCYCIYHSIMIMMSGLLDNCDKLRVRFLMKATVAIWSDFVMFNYLFQ